MSSFFPTLPPPLHCLFQMVRKDHPLYLRFLVFLIVCLRVPASIPHHRGFLLRLPFCDFPPRSFSHRSRNAFLALHCQDDCHLDIRLSSLKFVFPIDSGIFLGYLPSFFEFAFFVWFTTLPNCSYCTILIFSSSVFCFYTAFLHPFPPFCISCVILPLEHLFLLFFT